MKDKMDKKMKDGRMPIPGHDNCVNHIGGVCGDVLFYVLRNDPDRMDRIIQEI